jgi:hypothetical protein
MNFQETRVWKAFEEANQKYNQKENAHRQILERTEAEVLEAARRINTSKIELQHAVENYRVVNPSGYVSNSVMKAIQLLQKLNT